MTLQSLFGTLLVFTLLFSACTKNEELVPTEKTTEKTELTPDNIEQWVAENSDEAAKEVQVEYITLQELNAELVANGLEPVSQKNVEEAKANYRTLWQCWVWLYLADWNNSGTISVSDIVLAQQFLCTNVGCDGSYNTNNGPNNSEEQFFGYLSYLADGTGVSVLDRDGDIQAAVDYILGLIICT